MDRIDSQFTLSQLQREAVDARRTKAGEALEAVVEEPVESKTTQIKLPESLDPNVKAGIEKLRDAGITQIDFDAFLQSQKGQQNVELGNGTTGPIETSFAVNPTVREQIRRYLPEM
jgi:hypothetical protein